MARKCKALASSTIMVTMVIPVLLAEVSLLLGEVGQMFVQLGITDCHLGLYMHPIDTFISVLQHSIVLGTSLFIVWIKYAFF